MQSFDIYFLGEILPDADPPAARQGVAKLFKVREDAVEKLFSGNPLRVKQGVDADTASRYRSAFREVGALIQIVGSGAPAPAAKTPDLRTEPDSPATQQRDSAPEQPPLVQVDEEDDFGLAEPGAILDHSEPTAAADIDTGSLEALPANTGTLEDCKVEKPHRPIPDISHLQLVDD